MIKKRGKEKKKKRGKEEKKGRRKEEKTSRRIDNQKSQNFAAMLLSYIWTQYNTIQYKTIQHDTNQIKSNQIKPIQKCSIYYLCACDIKSFVSYADIARTISPFSAKNNFISRFFNYSLIFFYPDNWKCTDYKLENLRVTYNKISEIQEFCFSP